MPWNVLLANPLSLRQSHGALPDVFYLPDVPWPIVGGKDCEQSGINTPDCLSQLSIPMLDEVLDENG